MPTRSPNSLATLLRPVISSFLPSPKRPFSFSVSVKNFHFYLRSRLRFHPGFRSSYRRHSQPLVLRSSYASAHAPSPSPYSHAYDSVAMTSNPPEQATVEAIAAAAVVAKSSWFPMGYMESFQQWITSGTPEIAEHRVLSLIPHIAAPPLPLPPSKKCTTGTTKKSGQNPPQNQPLQQQPEEQQPQQKDPYGNRRWATRQVRLDKAKMALNEFTVERDKEEAQKTLVMVHGYGAGLGFYFKNYEPLSRDPNWKLYALDLPGMGRSERASPPFKTSPPAKNAHETIAQTENWFVDAIEEWRKSRGIDRFTLLGHSMGGYLSVAYCLRYPGRVEKLILASPVGVPDSEHAVVRGPPSNPTISPSASTELRRDSIDATAEVLAAELRPVGLDRIPGDSPSSSSGNVSSASSPASNPEVAAVPKRKIPKWAAYLWNSNVSPFGVIRAVGPFGPRLVSGWTSRRFVHLTDEEVGLVHSYAYNIFRLPGSGEYALAHLLAPGAYARYPLIHRIMGLKKAGPDSKPIPTTFLYGDSDWMDVDGGLEAVRRLSDGKVSGSPDSPNSYGADGSKLIIVPGAGHNLFIDAHKSFNETILDELREVTGSTSALQP